MSENESKPFDVFVSEQSPDSLTLSVKHCDKVNLLLYKFFHTCIMYVCIMYVRSNL